MNDLTPILYAIDQGDPHAAAQLLPMGYDELRKLAAQKLAAEKPGQTLQATALVHEAYVQLVKADQALHWRSRGHFFAAAAEAMRRILVDAARRERRPKHGGDRQRVELNELANLSDGRAWEVLSLHAAIEKLETESEEKARLVKLRYFAGLSHQDAAQAMGISRATADRYWGLRQGISSLRNRRCGRFVVFEFPLEARGHRNSPPCMALNWSPVMDNFSPRIDDIFLAALELAAAERCAYLDKACADNAKLRHRVERLLEALLKNPAF